VLRRQGKPAAKRPGQRKPPPALEAFFTTDLTLSAEEIVREYGHRWAVELFQSQDIKFTRGAFFFLVGHNRWFFQGQHVMHFDRPIWIHHHLFDDKLDHRLAVLVA
jgi:hypothetical protein